MKVGLLCPFYKERAIGGVETVIRTLIRKLPDKGIDAKLVPFMLGTGFPYGNPLLAPIVQGRAVLSALSGDAGRFDIIHSHHPFVTLPFALRKKTVMTFHVYSEDFYAPDGKGAGAANWLVRKGIHVPEYLGAAASRGVTAVSNHIKGKLASEVGIPEKKISVVHNGIDLALMDSRLGKNPYPEGGWDIFSLGRIWKPKGFHLLVRAAGRLGMKGLRIHIAGPKEDAAYAAQLELDAKARGVELHLLGPISEGEKCRRLHHADLVVLPSRFEGLSIVAIEALGASSAVIASDIPTFREVFADAAIFFRNGDESDLALKMGAALSDSARLRRMRSLARERRNLFSEERMVDGYLRAYSEA